jgi:hypothetical protein
MLLCSGRRTFVDAVFGHHCYVATLHCSHDSHVCSFGPLVYNHLLSPVAVSLRRGLVDFSAANIMQEPALCVVSLG